MSYLKIIPVIILAIFITAANVLADCKDNAKATRISGGQEHTLILTQNKYPWATGRNLYYLLGIGNNANPQYTPVRVHGFDDNGFLGDINDVSAGYIHSLALDANSSVWACGKNMQFSGLFYLESGSG
jgi:alpha-tubulin suppressor-like RCC1 family protein